MSRKTESRVYIAAFILVGVITIIICSYFDGRTDEAVRKDREQQQIVDEAMAKVDYWAGKYDALAHEADWLTVSSAEAKFQESAP